MLQRAWSQIFNAPGRAEWIKYNAQLSQPRESRVTVDNRITTTSIICQKNIEKLGARADLKNPPNLDQRADIKQ